MFLLPHREYASEPTLQRHCQLDSDADIDVKVLYVGEILPKLPVPPYGLDFGVWDGKILCAVQGGAEIGESRAVEWLVSRRPQDIELYTRLRETLLDGAEILPYLYRETHAAKMDEPLVTTAPLMERLSEGMCNRDNKNLDQGSCSWYHSIWQYLRIFDMVSTPVWHGRAQDNFFFRRLRDVANQRSTPRVLISGAADYSMLSHTLWAFDSANKISNITVLDLCRTPLAICEWYAGHTSHSVVTIRDDITKLEPDDPFDAIVTDAFLSRFERDSRHDVIEKWSSLLKRGGYVITTARVKDRYANADEVRSTAGQVKEFADRASEMADRWKDFFDMDIKRVVGGAETYATLMKSHPYSDVDEIKRDFSDCGFDVTIEIRSDTKGELTPTSTYAEISAVKLG